jgi:carboxyl-terminal processing protease
LGKTTFGKHAVQLLFDLDNGGELLVAVADWAGPSGTSVEGLGLEPDVEIDLPQTLSIDELVQIALDNA